MALEKNPVMTLYPFTEPYELSQIRFRLDNPETKNLSHEVQKIDSIIKKELEALGYDYSKNPLHLLPSEVVRLRKNIKQNKDWQESASDILRKNSENPAQVDIEIMLEKITRPWFNEILVYYGRATPELGSLCIDSSARHSYFTHFTDQLIPTGQNQVPLSVAGIPRLDDMIIMGYRGGHNYSDTIMTVPAGSVVIDPDLNLKYSFEKEMREELGNVHNKDLSSQPQVIGMMHDPRGKGWHYFIVELNLKDNLSDFICEWTFAPEREHRFLVPITDSYGAFIKFSSDRAYDISKEDPDNRAKVTPDNRGTMLPQAVGLILTSYARKTKEKTFETILDKSIHSGKYVVQRD